MRIENIIRKLRQKHKITQETLAKELNVSRQTIIAIEKGGYEPTLKLAYLIAKYFNLPIESVFSFHEKDIKKNYMEKRLK